MNKLKVTFSYNDTRVKLRSLTATTLFYRRQDKLFLYMVVAEETIPLPPMPASILPGVEYSSPKAPEPRIQAVNLMTGELLTIEGETLVYLATGELVAKAQGCIG